MALTPYDTGEVAEPHPWVTSTAGLTDTNHDDFGKVDFDNEESRSLIQVRLVRTGEGHTLEVVKYDDDLPLVITLDGVKVHW